MTKLTHEEYEHYKMQAYWTGKECISIMFGIHIDNIIDGKSIINLDMENSHHKNLPIQIKNFVETMQRSIGNDLIPIEYLLNLFVLGADDPTFVPKHFLEWARKKGFQVPKGFEIREYDESPNEWALPGEANETGIELKPPYAKHEKDHVTITVPAGTTWGQIKIRYVNDNHIHINCPGGGGQYSAHDLGLDSKRSLFPLFKLFAKGNGCLKPRDFKPLKANVSNLRRLLNNIFTGITDKSIRDYEKSLGIWECNFEISSSAAELDLHSASEQQSDIKDIFEESGKKPAKPNPAYKADY